VDEPEFPPILDRLLSELAAAWPPVEEFLERERPELYEAVRRAFRVEASYNWLGGGDEPDDYFLDYSLLYDEHDPEADPAIETLRESNLEVILDEMTPADYSPEAPQDVFPWGTKKAALREPLWGKRCPRRWTDLTLPDLRDLSNGGQDVPLIERDGFRLTPIEVPFYEALRETGLFFAVQPWIQGTDRRYRPDFIVFYDGGAVVVELDGHAAHKSKEQREYDANRDRWFTARKVTTLRWTGSEVVRGADKCIRELLDVLRGTHARP
jgi:very-short-patch-repair endonuclease